MKQGFLVVLWNGLFSEGGKEGAKSKCIRKICKSLLSHGNER